MLDERYEILAPLEKGALGVVYRARQLAVGREVLVRVLDAAWDDFPAIAERFDHEAGIIARLKGPAFPELIDTGRTPDGSLYVVTELVPGTPLDKIIERDPPELLRTLEIAVQVADALAIAHAAGLVHRDLCPRNIVVAERAGGEGGVYTRVLNFGLARVADNLLSRAQSICGSPGYMAPEQVEGVPVDVRADLYSLGCVIYECVTGCPVFNAHATLDLLSRHMNEAAPPLVFDKNGEAIDEELSELVARLLQKDPTARPHRVEEVRRVLAAVAERTSPIPAFKQKLAQPAPRASSIPPTAAPAPPALPAPRASSVAKRLPAPPEREAPHGFPTQLVAVLLVAMAALLIFGPGSILMSKSTGDTSAQVIAAQAPIAARVAAREIPPPMLTVVSRPAGARVWIDGRAVGFTPLVQRLAKREERLPIAVTLEGHDRHRALLHPGAGGDFSANVTLERGLDVRGFLEQPGVRLAVVVFAAGWNKTSAAETPRWRELARRFAREGVYSVLVVTQDQTLCEQPPWTADLLICDADGEIARRYHADPLPAAHLWSWQGELLAQRARAGEIENRVRAWLARAPEVAVEGDDRALADQVRAAIAARGRLRLATSPASRFAQVRDECASERTALPSKLRLRARAVRVDDREHLRLELRAAEDGCVIASSLAQSSDVDRGISELFEKLQKEPEALDLTP